MKGSLRNKQHLAFSIRKNRIKWRFPLLGFKFNLALSLSKGNVLLKSKKFVEKIRLVIQPRRFGCFGLFYLLTGWFFPDKGFHRELMLFGPGMRSKAATTRANKTAVRLAESFYFFYPPAMVKTKQLRMKFWNEKPPSICDLTLEGRSCNAS